MARTQTKSDASGKSIITSRSVVYSDFDLAFIKHPNTKDVTILVNERGIASAKTRKAEEMGITINQNLKELI